MIENSSENGFMEELWDVYVVRAFVKLRELLATNKGLSVKHAELERRLEGHDVNIRQLIGAIRELMNPPESKKKRPIGFGRENEN